VSTRQALGPENTRGPLSEEIGPRGSFQTRGDRVSTRGYSRGMGRTSEILYHRRRDEFLGPISMIARNSAAVHEIIDLYARGDIVTKEEALSQMVKALAARCRDS